MGENGVEDADVAADIVDAPAFGRPEMEEPLQRRVRVFDAPVGGGHTGVGAKRAGGFWPQPELEAPPT